MVAIDCSDVMKFPGSIRLDWNWSTSSNRVICWRSRRESLHTKRNTTTGSRRRRRRRRWTEFSSMSLRREASQNSNDFAELSRRPNRSQQPVRWKHTQPSSGECKKMQGIFVFYVDSKRLVDQMFQDGVLPLAEMETIRCKKTLNRFNDKSADLLNAKPIIATYDGLLTALWRTDRDDVRAVVMYNDYVFDSRHARVIRDNYVYLLETLDTAGLLVDLYSSGVFRSREKREKFAFWASRLN